MTMTLEDLMESVAYARRRHEPDGLSQEERTAFDAAIRDRDDCKSRIAQLESERDAWKEKYDLSIAEWVADFNAQAGPIIAERDALRKRIEDSPSVPVHAGGVIDRVVPQYSGERVRLVLDDQ